MKGKNKGLVLGALLFVFFTMLAFKDEFYFSILKHYNFFMENVNIWIPKLVIIIIIFLVAHLLVLSINAVLLRYFKYAGRNKEYFSAYSITKYVVWLLAILGMLSVIIGNLGVWLTSVGLIGFGVTFALQKPILNFVGWMTIIFGKTYTIGDRIKVGEQRGDVIDVQMMYTIMDGLIEDSDELSGKIVTIPNEQVLTSPITNFTRNGEYIWDNISVDITYESDWQKASQILKDVSYEVVNRYVKMSGGEISEKRERLAETLSELKKNRLKTEKPKDKLVIEKRLNELKEEKQKLDGEKRVVLMDIKREPDIRVDLRGSSVGLSVRYIAHYKSLRRMESEINSEFLRRIAKIKNIEVAYPHMQIVGRR